MNVDIAIVGKTGKELYDTSSINHPYTFFDLPDVLHSMEELKPLISHILQYEHVTVFYGRFVNIVTQEAAYTSISGDEQVETIEKQERPKEYGFIFEPSIEEVLDFFETQIFSSLFKQTIVEAELARLASRIKAMEQAIVFINTRIGALTLAER